MSKTAVTRTFDGNFVHMVEYAEVKGKRVVILFVADRHADGEITNKRYFAKLKPKSARRFAQWILDNVPEE